MKKTIFRLTYAGLLLAAIVAFGAVAGLAQDPACTDVAGQNAMQDEFDKLYANKTDLDVRQQAINSGKSFLEKYGSCDSAKERADWLKANLPKMEDKLKTAREAAVKDAAIKRFNTALAAKNWDEVTAASKDLMTRWPADFSGLELVLGSIGYDELFANNPKYTDQTIEWAKRSLNDLQANKDFKPGYGVKPFEYKSREDAIAWMNLTIGTLYQLGKKDKVAALPYLYAATQAPATSDVAKNPNPYEFVGNYYFDQLNGVIAEIKALTAKQDTTTNPDDLKALVQQIKDKVAMSNGISERAMDAFARAYALGTKADYKAKMKGNVADAYKVRYGTTGPVTVDQFISSTAAKPFVNPTTPVQPIADPEPVKTTTGTAEGPAATPPVKTQTPVKPASPTATKKPGVALRKPAAKKRGA